MTSNNPITDNDQYHNDKKLVIRQRLHQMYSTNSLGLMPWFRDQIQIAPGNHVLELGCGNGSLWNGWLSQLPVSADFVLSDYSQGMVDVVNKAYGRDPRVDCRQVDIQNIPFASQTFDVVIANHTLHTVPNIQQAIQEVHRVLKPTGTFYAAANGAEGMEHYLDETIQTLQPGNLVFSGQLPFNLQNGPQQLETSFSQVTRIDYRDSLRITDTDDLIAWIVSTRNEGAGLDDKLLNQLRGHFEELRQKDGAIVIPKQAGLLKAQA